MNVTYRGLVYPAQCDAMGHMNVQHFVAAFDQAMWHLILQLGFKPSWVNDRREGWADVRYLINFRNELRAGQLFHVDSAISKIGNTSLVTFHTLVDSEGRETAADVEMTSVYFNLATRSSMQLPSEVRTAAELLLST